MMGKFMQVLGSGLLVSAMIAGLNGCGDSDKAPPPAAKPAPPAPLTVGGTVSGLTGNGLVLQLNGANDLTVNPGDKFKFPTALTKGSAYAVTVKAQPSTPVKQTCTIAQGGGNIAGAPINNIAITCTTNSFAVGGTAKGISGKGLVLQLNGANDLAIAKNGKFIFTGVRLPDGSDYNVAIKTTPARLKCEMKSVSAAFDSDTMNIVAVTCKKH